MRTRSTDMVRAIVIVTLTSHVAVAWWGDGHQVMTRAALQRLPDDVPAFFRESADTIAHYVVDPDVLREKISTHLADRERPEHFIDMEHLKGRKLPAKRSLYIKMCHDLKLDPHKVGTLPYAVAEWTEKLAIAFAEHRRWPDNEAIRWKCRFYAGILAHYAQDLCQPLHLTIHYDGRARPDGSSPRTGIHVKVDALIGRLELKPNDVAADVEADVFPDLFPAIVAQIHRVGERIDDVYALESDLPATEGPLRTTPPVRRFALDQARSGAAFTASLWLTVWRRSAEIRLPNWLQRR